MIEDELIKIWQSSPNQERVKFEKSRLMIDVQTSVDRLHKAIKFRDLREIIAAMIVIPIFGLYAFIFPFILSKIASVLIILYAIFVIIRLRSAKKHKPGEFTETYLEYLLKTRDYIRIQKRLLETVLYWYILPGLTLVTMFTIGFFESPKVSTGMFVFSFAFYFVVGVGLYLLNKRAVKKVIDPQLEKVEQLIKVIQE